MASIKTDARLRIADGLVVIALAITSIFMIWRGETEAWFGIMQSLMVVVLVFLGVVVLIGRARTVRLVLTRRRWKYLALVGLILAAIIVFVATSMLPARPEGNLALPLFPLLVGLFLVQLYEPETSAQFKPSDLSERDAKVWNKIGLVLAIIGIVLGCIAGAAGATGDLGMLAFLLPIGILFLVFAAGIWMMLRKRNRQLRPKS